MRRKLPSFRRLFRRHIRQDDPVDPGLTSSAVTPTTSPLESQKLSGANNDTKPAPQLLHLDFNPSYLFEAETRLPSVPRVPLVLRRDAAVTTTHAILETNPSYFNEQISSHAPEASLAGLWPDLSDSDVLDAALGICGLDLEENLIDREPSLSMFLPNLEYLTASPISFSEQDAFKISNITDSSTASIPGPELHGSSPLLSYSSVDNVPTESTAKHQAEVGTPLNAKEKEKEPFTKVISKAPGFFGGIPSPDTTPRRMVGPDGGDLWDGRTTVDVPTSPPGLGPPDTVRFRPHVQITHHGAL